MCIRRVTIMATASMLLAACSDITTTNGVHQVDVTLQQGDGLVLAAPAFATAANAQGKLLADQVDSLFLTITTISFLSVAEDEESEASWMSFALPEPITVDLLALPTEEATPLIIASGELPAGDYEKLRFRISASSIFLNTRTTVGNSTFDPDTPYEVTVPSGATAGLKTDLGFSVADDVEVNLLFSPKTTFDGVTATGNGKVILSPVLMARDQLE